jgi:hypothetical protein
MCARLTVGRSAVYPYSVRRFERNGGPPTPAENRESPSVGCLAVKLTDAQLDQLDAISRFQPGFPHDFLTAAFTRTVVHGSLADRIDAGRRPIRNGMLASARGR